MFCQECGREIRQSARFCNKCGAEVKQRFPEPRPPAKRDPSPDPGLVAPRPELNPPPPKPWLPVEETLIMPIISKSALDDPRVDNAETGRRAPSSAPPERPTVFEPPTPAPPKPKDRAEESRPAPPREVDQPSPRGPAPK